MKSNRFSFCVTVLTLLAVGSVASAQKSGSWPQWRGPNRDGVSTEKGLLKAWPEDGPKVAWKIDSVGVGYSSLAVSDGRIFTQGDIDGVEHIICINAKDGKVLWAVQPEPVANGLSERIAQEMKRLDTNRDGTIDELEALSRLGWTFNKFDKPTDGDAEQVAAQRSSQLFAKLDEDKDGQLTYKETRNLFRREYNRIDSQDKEVDADALVASRTSAFLKQLDKDADGKISRQESRGSLAEVWFNRADRRDPTTNRGDQQLTAEEIQQYLTKSEAGRDGLISADELKTFYTRSNVRGDGELSAAEMRGLFGGYRNGQGDGPRGTPTVDGTRVYAEGGNGDLTCLEAATGKTIWHVNMSSDLGGGRPGWGYSESPLVEGNLLIVTPGGKNGTVAALDKYTGEVIWQSSETTQGAHYASAVVAEIAGVRQVVQFARTSVFGLAANSGKLLWQYDGANNGTANCAAPIVYKDHVFTSSGYGTGGGLAKISNDGDAQAAEEVYFEKKMANHHGGIVRVGDYMYSNGSGTLICMNYLTGKIEWQARSVGKGSLLAADGMLYLLSERHQVGLAEVTPEGYKEHGRFSIESHGRPSWAHPVVAGGRLYIRDQQSLIAYDISDK